MLLPESLQKLRLKTYIKRFLLLAFLFSVICGITVKPYFLMSLYRRLPLLA